MSDVLLKVTRGDITECVHRGDIAIVDTKGDLLYEVGDAGKITYMRSSAKPIQAMNVQLSGTRDYYQFSNKELAIMCASHYAEKEHLETVEKILKKTGLDKSYLLAGKSKPLSKKVAFQYAWDNKYDDVLFNDCSGKHAGMLAVCKKKNYPIKQYTEPEHPVQKEILSLLGEMTHFDPGNIILGIDGCSLPVHALPLFNMARGYANLANPVNLDEKMAIAASNIFEAMVEHPFMIAGTNGFCTDLINAFKGRLIGKIGAEGIYCVGLKDKGIGIAVKIENGSMEVLPPIILKVLEELNYLGVEEKTILEKYRIMNNYNDVGTIVGNFIPTFHL